MPTTSYGYETYEKNFDEFKIEGGKKRSKKRRGSKKSKKRSKSRSPNPKAKEALNRWRLAIMETLDSYRIPRKGTEDYRKVRAAYDKINEAYKVYGA